VIIPDTNVISELARETPDATVTAWLHVQSLFELATTTINVAEIKFGLARLTLGRRRSELEARFGNFAARAFPDRIFGFDANAAGAFGEIAAACERSGRRLAAFDGLIAAIALSRGAGIATRDIRGFDGCGIQVINPGEAGTA
jgi:predicted nucleic acid-binding protein